jgi:uncharacterized membrane protein
MAFKPGLADFWRRWAEVAAAAALVSLGSWLMFGPRFIWFGILHFIAVALLLARPLVRLGAWNLALAVVAFVAWLVYADPAFNATPANAIGFVTQKAAHEDYVPLFPWLAAVLRASASARSGSVRTGACPRGWHQRAASAARAAASGHLGADRVPRPPAGADGH